MDIEQALNTLEESPSPVPSKRLRCARYLAKNATEADLGRLLRIRNGEHDSWIQQALDQAISRIEDYDTMFRLGEEGGKEEIPAERPFYDDLYDRATEEISAMFVHELLPLVGSLRLDANAEINCYGCSNTRNSVEGIRSFLRAVDSLYTAFKTPIIRDFDLTDLIARVSEIESRRYLFFSGKLTEEEDGSQFPGNSIEQLFELTGVRLTLTRTDPVLSSGAPNLVELALGNVFRNAIEAILAVQSERQGEIVINWGLTDVDSWIAVLDEGCGLPAKSNRLMEPFRSTKSGGQSNFGLGLTIAKRAVKSMNGTIELTPQNGVGVKCEIRWPQRSNLL